MAEEFEQVLVRLTPELHAALKACAEDEDRTKSATIRCAIRAWVDRRNDPDYPRSIPNRPPRDIGSEAEDIRPAPFQRMEPRLKSTKKGTP